MKVIIFDMDGVLVDTSQSYSLVIKKTAEFFLKKKLDSKIVVEYKDRGGLNNDYDCTRAILMDKGKKVPREEIIDVFQNFYLGKNWDGLIKNEKWLLDKNILDWLSKRYTLCIFTGRPRKEAEFALKSAGTLKYFKRLICMEDVKHGKPNPEGLLKLMKELRTKEALYVGDLVDDVRAAKNANIDFIGVIAPGIDKKKAKDILKKNGAKVITNNVNDIGKALRSFKSS